MKEWHFNVLFFVGVGSAIFLLVAPLFGLQIDPIALTGVGTILTYVLTQKPKWVSSDEGEAKKEGDRSVRDGNGS